MPSRLLGTRLPAGIPCSRSGERAKLLSGDCVRGPDITLHYHRLTGAALEVRSSGFRVLSKINLLFGPAESDGLPDLPECVDALSKLVWERRSRFGLTEE